MQPTLVVWRDSVAAGDDADAPHEWLLPTTGEATVADVVGRIMSERYLAGISTGEATWIIEGARPIAVVAQQWTAPRFLVDPGSHIRDVVKPDGRPHLEARYWLQVSPDRVFEALLAGRTLPERYGR